MRKNAKRLIAIVMIVLVVAVTLPVENGNPANAREQKQWEQSKQQEKTMVQVMQSGKKEEASETLTPEVPTESPTPTAQPPMEIIPDVTALATVKDGIIYGKGQISLPVIVRNLTEDTQLELTLQESSYADQQTGDYNITTCQWQDGRTAEFHSNITKEQQTMVRETYRFQATSQQQTVTKDLTLVWDSLAPTLTLSYSEEELAELSKVRGENLTLHYQAEDPSVVAVNGQEILGIGVKKVYAEFQSSEAGALLPKTVETNSTNTITLDFQGISEFHGVCRLYAVDYLGNISKPIEVPLHIDKAAPKIVITGGKSNQWEEKLVITAKAYDYCFPEKMDNTFWYVMDGDNIPKYDGITWEKNQQESTEFQQVYDITVTVSKERYSDYNGTCTIYARDRVGNIPRQAGENNQFNAMFDSTAPVFQGIVVTDQQKNPLEQVCNKVSFGMFFQHKIRMEVSAADLLVNHAASGIASLNLTVDGVEYHPQEVQGLGTESCVAVYFIEQEKKYSSFVFTVTDNSGNSTSKTIGEIDSLLNTPAIYLDATAPTLSMKVKKDGVNTYKDKEKRNWYQKDISFQVVAGDSLTGIKKIEVEINGKKITKDVQGNAINEKEFSTKVVTRKEFIISTSQGKSQTKSKGGEEGRYDVTILVTDNAGNVTTKTRTIYIDTKAPYIKKVQVLGTGSLEGNGKLVTRNCYEYFIQGKGEVLVTAADDTASCGVKSITYYTVNYNSGKEGIVSREKTIPVDEKEQAIIKLPDKFRGAVYLKTEDNVGNVARTYKRPGYIITGTQKGHESKSDIQILLPETGKKDSKGNPLYGETITAKIKVKDTDMGLRKVAVYVTSPQDASKNQQREILVEKKGTFSDTSIMQAVSKDKNLITEAEGELFIANDSNDICVTVELTDRAGMTCKKQVTFSIDKKKPVIEVTYDKETPQESYLGEGNFYKEDRTATIVVKERNFDASRVQVKITNGDGVTPSLTAWEKGENTKNPDETTYTAKVAFTQDGKYTMEISACDSVDNQAEPYHGETFVIDKTKPVTEITWDKENASHENYYNENRSATITITEHNFDQSKVELIPVSSDTTEAGSFPKLSAFQSQGDVHRATIEFTEDGNYSFQVAYSDKAGNQGEIATADTFVIDKTEPELSFEGVKEKGAYKEEVSPVIVCKDKNLDASTLRAQVTMTNGKNDTVQVEDALGQLQTNGDTYSIALKNPQSLRENDGIYRVTASVMDYAGNEKEATISYSVNRFGSVYTLQKEAKRVAGSYVKNAQAISIVETNADDINGKDVKVKLTKNGQVKELTEGKEYNREENAEEGSWKQYIYTLSEDNFTEDGVYMVSISSKDKAGNHNDNTAEGEEGAKLWFGVDKTSPVIVPLNIQSEESYNLNSLQVQMEVQDNLKLDNVKTYVNNQEVVLEQSKDQEHYTFTLQESTKEQTIRMVALDAAGNETVRELKGIYITTNPWVRFIHNKKWVVSVAVILAAVVILGSVALLLRKHRKNK